MVPTEGRVARPERWWGCRHGTLKNRVVPCSKENSDDSLTSTIRGHGRHREYEVKGGGGNVRLGARHRWTKMDKMTKLFSGLDMLRVSQFQHYTGM